jgi:hypothetical protein
MRENDKAEFRVRLKKWRGIRTQQEAARALQVPLRTYEGWEAGRPIGGLAVVTIDLRMEANPKFGVAPTGAPEQK